MASFDGTDETIDSREVIGRIQELIAEFTDTTDSDPADVMSVDDWAYGLGWEDAEELVALIEFAEEGESLPDWEYGETLIHEDYFEVYVEELVRDLGYLPDEVPGWISIDWSETADNMRVDYTSFEFRGATYYARG